MRWKVLISAPYMQAVIDSFRPIFEENDIELLVPPVQERLTEEDLLQWVWEVDGVISGDDQFTERVLNKAPRLKVISKWGTGIDSIDVPACKRLGIAVRNTPNAFSEPVADSVMGYILAFARNLIMQDRHMKRGTWRKVAGRSLRECVLGVIGVGNVGKALVHRAAAFGIRLLGNDLLDMPSDFLARTGIEMVSKEALLRKADFISLNCDLNPTTYHLINNETLALVRPAAVLINTARGPVVDEVALIRSLKEERLAGAALDVFEAEPLSPESPFRKMDNVLLAPHNANSSPESWDKVHRSTINNLLEGLRGT
jgi:D-3-phosphoglycerate dehydrogenase